MPAKKRGRPPQNEITQQEMADRCGVSVRTLREWAKSESLDITDEASVKVRVARLHEKQKGTEDEKEAKLRKTKAEADMIEHKLSVQRGEFVPAHEMDRDGVQIGMAVAAVFSRMPDDLAPLCAGRTAGEIKKLVTKYAREKRTELSQYESRIQIPTNE